MHFTPLPITAEVTDGLIGSIFTVFLCLLIVALRFTARFVAGSQIGWDDYLMLAAVPQGVALVVCHALYAMTGVGQPWDAINMNRDFIFTMINVSEIIFTSCTVTVKLSVLIFYYRVFTCKYMHRASKIIAVLVVAWGVANTVQTLLTCHSIDNGAPWSLFATDHCPKFIVMLQANCIFNIISNIVISLLPLYTIWSFAKLSVSTRLYLSAVVLFSTSVTILGIIRVTYTIRNITGPDPAASLPTSMLMTVLEANLSIATNSLPMLVPLYSYWRYRKVWSRGEDEYVSRLRGDDNNDQQPAPAARPPSRFGAVEDIINGMSLEKIYGINGVHFSVRVERGSVVELTRQSPEPEEGGREAWGGEGGFGSSGEDLVGLAASGKRRPSAAVIQIETKWSITEERTGGASHLHGTP